MSDVVLYGIPNCDSVKKARRWLDENAIPYHFHNFKRDGVPEEVLSQWITEHGIELTVNRRGTTWRKLHPEQKTALTSNSAAARALIIENPSIIKRPVLSANNTTLLGFSPTQWMAILD